MFCFQTVVCFQPHRYLCSDYVFPYLFIISIAETSSVIQTWIKVKVSAVLCLQIFSCHTHCFAAESSCFHVMVLKRTSLFATWQSTCTIGGRKWSWKKENNMCFTWGLSVCHGWPVHAIFLRTQFSKKYRYVKNNLQLYLITAFYLYNYPLTAYCMPYFIFSLNMIFYTHCNIWQNLLGTQLSHCTALLVLEQHGV